jgi:uncharacterized membrane protein YcaP (DUF421 family)
MHEMLHLSMPWWMFILRGMIAYVGLLLLVRLSGKHSLGEMSAFDILMLVLVGSVLRTAILGEDHSVLGPFIAVITIFALDKALAMISARSPGFNRLMEGVPSLLARRGRCEPGALQRHDIAEQAFHTALRAHGLRDVAQVEEVRLEPNGKISVIKRGGQESG